MFPLNLMRHEAKADEQSVSILTTLATLYQMKSIITEIKRLHESAPRDWYVWQSARRVRGVGSKAFHRTDMAHCTNQNGDAFSTLDGKDEYDPEIVADLIAFYRNNTPALAEAYEKLFAVAERMAEALQSAGTTDTDTMNWIRFSQEALAAFKSLD